MIERIGDMPAGTIGFRATGSVTGDEYRDTLQMFAWMTPGEVRLFDLDELEAAKEWVAG